MSIGSQLAGSVGLAAESTYGTFITPARWLQVNVADIKKVKNTFQGGGLSGGTFMQPGSRRVVTTMAAAGTLQFEATDKQMGLLIGTHGLGSAAAPVQQGGTTAYLQTHALSDNVGKYMTVQVGDPDASGTVRPYSYLGCKILSMEFSCTVDQPLLITLTIDARDVTEAQSLTAPSYSAGLIPFHFGQMGVKLGTFGAEAAVQGVKSMSLKFDRPQDTGRFYANNAGLKSEPIWNNWGAVTGTIEADYIDKTVFADRYAADAPTSVVWEFIGPIIASTFAKTFRLRVPQVFFETDSPTLNGGDGIITQSINYTGQYDGSNPPLSFEYISVDTAV